MRANLALVEPTPRYELLSGHPASDYQAAIFDVMSNASSGSRIIKAVAGSGKTTVLKNALRFLPPGQDVQLFAFNTDAAGTLKAAVDEVRAACGDAHARGFRAGTFHSICYGALCRRMGWKTGTVKPDARKSRKLLKERCEPDDFETYGSFAAALVGFAKGEGIGALCADTEERWWDLVEHHGLYLDSEDADPARGVEIARKLLAYGNRMAKEKHVIDYDDMIYLTLLWKVRLWRNDVVFVDESQDTNPVRRAVARLALKAGGRLFAVGDPKQSIYGFCGASCDAMDLIAADFAATEMPLTVSYRCARTVVAHAQRWVPYLESHDDATEGEVREGVPLDEALGLLTPADAVLCRQTAPLVGLAYRLIGQGRGCRILGRDIGEGLIALVRAQKARGIDRLIAKLEAFRDRECARFEAKGEETRAEAVADRVACVLTTIAALPETDRTVPALERRIDEVFQQKAGVLTLATVHKAKGAEWENVAILRPDLMPGRARQEWAAAQEENLQYVAATRAKRLLIYIEV